ncbi:hypothetical protein MMC14_001713 [Varicellaria rhodocarpa]|nr:hypothetical protein [Varicellaria rhodocarpa]
MHTHLSTSLLTKRITDPSVQCFGPYEGWEDLLSRCTREISPQAYVVYCFTPALHHGALPPAHEYPGFRVQNGACSQYEICVERHEPNEYDADRTVAMCVQAEEYRRIQSTAAGSSMGAVQIPGHQNNNGAVAVDAVLTGQSITNSLRAQSITINALKRLFSISNIPHFGTASNGTASCQNCYDLVLQPIPAAIDLLTANAVLAPGSKSGVLYLTTIS